MATPYSDVYSAFLSLITEDFYAEIESIQVNSTESYNKKKELIHAANADLKEILTLAKVKFRYPRIPINGIGDSFENVLTEYEIHVLAVLMREIWCSRWVNSLDVIRQNWGDRDFSYTSQANHLKALIQMQKMSIAESKRAQIDYSRAIDHKPNFEGLAGG